MEVLNNLALFLLQTEISNDTREYLMTKNYKRIEYKLNNEMEGRFTKIYYLSEMLAMRRSAILCFQSFSHYFVA